MKKEEEEDEEVVDVEDGEPNGKKGAKGKGVFWFFGPKISALFFGITLERWCVWVTSLLRRRGKVCSSVELSLLKLPSP